MTSYDNPARTTEHASCPRLLVVVLLAVLAFGGSGYSSPAASSGDASRSATSASDEFPADATKAQMKGQRSVTRQCTRQPLSVPVIGAGIQCGTTLRRWLLRSVALMAPMWRAPPVLQL